MAPTPTGTENTSLPSPKAGGANFRRYAWAVLAYNLGVVVWGAYVRATGSGAGCGNHWPLCNGAITPPSPTTATLIEFTHRVTSGLDLLLVALLVFWAFRAFPRGHRVRRGAVFSAIFLASEALIGAALVLLEQVAKNTSVARAYSLSAHLVNTLTLLACITLTAWWATPPRRKPKTAAASDDPRGVWFMAASFGLVMLLGISGAIAALGDTLFPARSLAAGFAQDFDPSANIFLRLRGLHPLIAVITGAWLFWFAAWTARRRPQAQNRAWMLGLLVGAQLTAGLMNLLMLAPVWMQLVHLLLADLVWISLVLLCA